MLRSRGAFCGAKSCGAQHRKMPREKPRKKIAPQVLVQIKSNRVSTPKPRIPYSFQLAPGFFAQPYYD